MRDRMKFVVIESSLSHLGCIKKFKKGRKKVKKMAQSKGYDISRMRK